MWVYSNSASRYRGRCDVENYETSVESGTRWLPNFRLERERTEKGRLWIASLHTVALLQYMTPSYCTSQILKCVPEFHSHTCMRCGTTVLVNCSSTRIDMKWYILVSRIQATCTVRCIQCYNPYDHRLFSFRYSLRKSKALRYIDRICG